MEEKCTTSFMSSSFSLLSHVRDLLGKIREEQVIITARFKLDLPTLTVGFLSFSGFILPFPPLRPLLLLPNVTTVDLTRLLPTLYRNAQAAFLLW